MEEHRLRPMQEGYDEELFNRLYQELIPLKRKLASQINTKTLNIEYDELLSWFDVKFLFVFNRYIGEGKSDDLVKGHLISALQLYKNRILKFLISKKNSVNIHTVDITEVNNLSYSLVDYQHSEEKIFYDLIISFMKETLSIEAYKMFAIEYNPPLYIINKLEGNTNRITTKVIMDYLGLPDTKEVLSYIRQLRNEVRNAIELARVELN